MTGLILTSANKDGDMASLKRDLSVVETILKFKYILNHKYEYDDNVRRGKKNGL